MTKGLVRNGDHVIKARNGIINGTLTTNQVPVTKFARGTHYTKTISRYCVNSLVCVIANRKIKQEGDGGGRSFSKRHTKVPPSKAKALTTDLLHKNEQQMLSLSQHSSGIVYTHTLTSNCVIKSLCLLTSVARIMSSMRLKISCLENKDKQYINVCVPDHLSGYRNMIT